MAIFQSGASCLLSTIITVLLFSAMQIYKPYIATSPILGGFIGSWIFIFALTAFSNFESMVFGKNSQAKMFPEITICLFIGLLSAGLVHRVSVTSCFMLSLINLYFVHNISQKTYSVPEKVVPVPTHSSKKKNK
ncbi:protein KRTCAP2 homolog [Chrysoperla carnea]|uniref:protein KRTCAP2 homolog n=1 Tax=Chrysoperla carnea TaxID=189513 RepID=UPI001D05E281|nr:protein KRTCAP2 homolog [Chrysoperla carnea]